MNRTATVIMILLAALYAVSIYATHLRARNIGLEEKAELLADLHDIQGDLTNSVYSRGTAHARRADAFRKTLKRLWAHLGLKTPAAAAVLAETNDDGIGGGQHAKKKNRR